MIDDTPALKSTRIAPVRDMNSSMMSLPSLVLKYDSSVELVCVFSLVNSR